MYKRQVWDDAWDVLAAAKAEAEEERKAQAQQLAEHVRAQAEQHAPARAAASNGTATATAGGVRSRRARAEARQAKRPRDERAARGETGAPGSDATAADRNDGGGGPASLSHSNTALPAAHDTVQRTSDMSNGDGAGNGPHAGASGSELAAPDGWRSQNVYHFCEGSVSSHLSRA